jgi:hypothetical protein
LFELCSHFIRIARGAFALTPVAVTIRTAGITQDRLGSHAKRRKMAGAIDLPF